MRPRTHIQGSWLMKLLTWSVTVKASRSSGHSEPLLPFIAVVPRALELLAIAPEILAGRRGGLVSTTHPGDPGPVSARDSWSNSHTALASLAKALYCSPLSFHLSSGQLDQRVPGPARALSRCGIKSQHHNMWSAASYRNSYGGSVLTCQAEAVFPRGWYEVT